MLVSGGKILAIDKINTADTLSGDGVTIALGLNTSYLVNSATQEEVNAGEISSAYVSPATINNFSNNSINTEKISASYLVGNSANVSSLSGIDVTDIKDSVDFYKNSADEVVSVYNTVNSNSGNWNESYSYANENSAKNNSVYNTVNSNSGNWNDVSSKLDAKTFDEFNSAFNTFSADITDSAVNISSYINNNESLWSANTTYEAGKYIVISGDNNEISVSGLPTFDDLTTVRSATQEEVNSGFTGSALISSAYVSPATIKDFKNNSINSYSAITVGIQNTIQNNNEYLSYSYLTGTIPEVLRENETVVRSETYPAGGWNPVKHEISDVSGVYYLIDVKIKNDPAAVAILGNYNSAINYDTTIIQGKSNYISDCGNLTVLGKSNSAYNVGKNIIAGNGNLVKRGSNNIIAGDSNNYLDFGNSIINGQNNSSQECISTFVGGDSNTVTGVGFSYTNGKLNNAQNSIDAIVIGSGISAAGVSDSLIMGGPWSNNLTGESQWYYSTENNYNGLNINDSHRVIVNAVNSKIHGMADGIAIGSNINSGVGNYDSIGPNNIILNNIKNTNLTGLSNCIINGIGISATDSHSLISVGDSDKFINGSDSLSIGMKNNANCLQYGILIGSGQSAKCSHGALLLGEGNTIDSVGTTQINGNYNSAYKAENTTVIGYKNSVTNAQNSLTIGSGNSADYLQPYFPEGCVGSVTIGNDNSVSASGSYVLGSKNKTTSGNTYAFGYNLNAVASAGLTTVVLGRSNYINDAALIVGNGNSGYKNDAMVVTRDESLILNSRSNVASNGSIAGGGGNNSETRSIAFGGGCQAYDYSIAVGGGNDASSYSVAFGGGAHADNYGFAMGGGCYASQHSVALGDRSHAENNSLSFGGGGAYDNSISLGEGNFASAHSVTIGGSGNSANNYGFTIGSVNTAENYSLAQGLYNKALGHSNHAEGFMTYTDSHAAHAEGQDTSALATGSHSEGTKGSTFGVFSHAEGQSCSAFGNMSHAEGEFSQTQGFASHAEGNNTCALSIESHSEGTFTSAFGNGSHVEGVINAVYSNYSHAEGSGTIASGYSPMHAEGTYNDPTEFSGISAAMFQIGSGTSDTSRGNCFTVTCQGKTYIPVSGVQTCLNDSLSGISDWNSTYNTVSSNSASWGQGGSSNAITMSGLSGILVTSSTNNNTLHFDVSLSGEMGFLGTMNTVSAVNGSILSNNETESIGITNKFVLYTDTNGTKLLVPENVDKFTLNFNEQLSTDTTSDGYYYLNGISFQSVSVDGTVLKTIWNSNEYFASQAMSNDINFSVTVDNKSNLATPFTYNNIAYKVYDVKFTGDVPNGYSLTYRLTLIEDVIGFNSYSNSGTSDGKIAWNENDYVNSGASYWSNKISLNYPLYNSYNSDDKIISVGLNSANIDVASAQNVLVTTSAGISWTNVSSLNTSYKVAINSSDNTPGYLLDKIVSSNESISITSADGAVNITLNNDYENVMTPAAPFAKILCDGTYKPGTSTNDGVVCPINFPSGEIESISFFPGKIASGSIAYIAVYGKSDDHISGAAKWFETWNTTIPNDGLIKFNTPISIKKYNDDKTEMYRYNWVVICIRSSTDGGTEVNAKINNLVAITGNGAALAGIGLASNVVTNSTTAFNDTFNYSINGSPNTPYIQFNIVK